MKVIFILIFSSVSFGVLANSRIIIKDAKTLESVSYNVSGLTKTKSKSIQLYPNINCSAKVFLNPRKVGNSIVKTWVLMCDIGKIKIAPTFPCIKNSKGLVGTNLAETYIDNGSGGKRIKFECGDFSLGPF
tara:strand:+ start:494 stop:886 length:393 start_codon:yes stop_codon:yes gene_type:complete